MTKEYFGKFCEEIIIPYTDQLKKIDDDLGVKCLEFNRKSLNKVYGTYENKRMEIRKYFMNEENKPMDRHKIGSVMMYAILKSRLLHIHNLYKTRVPHQLLMANEYLAVYVALSVVESYRRDDCKTNGFDVSACDEKLWRLLLPNTYHDDSYIDNLCKSLYYIPDISKFDIFAYSNILYLLEIYTDSFGDKTE